MKMLLCGRIEKSQLQMLRFLPRIGQDVSLLRWARIALIRGVRGPKRAA